MSVKARDISNWTEDNLRNFAKEIEELKNRGSKPNAVDLATYELVLKKLEEIGNTSASNPSAVAQNAEQVDEKRADAVLPNDIADLAKELVSKYAGNGGWAANAAKAGVSAEHIAAARKYINANQPKEPVSSVPNPSAKNQPAAKAPGKKAVVAKGSTPYADTVGGHVITDAETRSVPTYATEKEQADQRDRQRGYTGETAQSYEQLMRKFAGEGGWAANAAKAGVDPKVIADAQAYFNSHKATVQTEVDRQKAVAADRQKRIAEIMQRGQQVTAKGLGERSYEPNK